MKSNAVRYTARSASSVFNPDALLLLLFSILSFGLAGCAGFVTANSNNSNPALAVSNVQASAATLAGFQVDWATNIAANSSVEYGKTASYGSSTAVNSTMVTSHQVSVTGLTQGTLYHFRVTSTDAKGATANSSDFTFSTSADKTPPTVSITAPAGNATLSGTATLTASASDSVGVASVQFRVDSSNVGAPITTTPYSYSLNTTTLSNGAHVITAVATDTVGNSATSAGVSVTISNNATSAPSISSSSPASGAVGTSVTVAGANFGASQGSSTVKFNGTTATPNSWSATSIVTTVPAGATTGNVVVTVNGTASNGVSFTVTTSAAPSITSLNPTSGAVGTSVTIAGANFGSTQGSSTVKFNGTTATPTSWSATSIVTTVPTGATTGNVVVTVGGVASNGVSFTVTTFAAPSIASLNPTSGAVGTSVTIAGANFGSTQGSSTVKFNGTTATPTSWSATSIVTKVPTGATTGNVLVTVGGTASNGVNFSVQADTTPPTVPTGLTATAVSSSQINLSWTASTDNVGVAGYNIYRGGTKIGTAPSTSYQDAGLAASTSYTYNVSAFDAAGNTSAQSAGASATTQAATSGGGIPSGLGWYQIPSTNISPLCPTYSEIQATEGCPAVMADWSGGLFDSTRNRLIIWGGGHDGYFGNEVYAIDLNANPIAPVLVKDATHGSNLTAPSGCSEANADGTPDSRHSYSGLTYIPTRDIYMIWGGSKASCGFFSDGLWSFNPSTLAWTQINYGGSSHPDPAASGSTPIIGYDTVNDALYVMDHNSATYWNYTFSNSQWNLLANEVGCNNVGLTSDIDPGRRLFMCAGNGQLYKIKLDSPYTATQMNGTGCSALLSAEGPGFAYDPNQKLMVGWAGGNTVYLYNVDTDSCTTQTYSGGPTTVQANGTYGRFRYSPALGVFVVANSIDTNAYSLRLTPASGGGSSGPAISNISVNSITTSGATVTWTTDVAATSQVEYGTTTSYGTLTTLNSTLVTSHSVTLTGLSANTVYHYAVMSANSSGTQSVSGDAVFQTSSGTSSTPPVVSITAPAANSTVSGTVTVSATATDTLSIASVQFLLDGANLGSALTTSPYSVSWNTTTATNATHVLSAQAIDTAGNVGTAVGVSVTVSNSSSSLTPLQDFQNRCAAAGVIVCEGFDDAAEFVPATSPNTGLYSNSGNIEIVQDATEYTSGGGALKFPMTANGAPVQDNNWLQTFCSAHPPSSCTPTVFQQNSDFYIQFRYRVDSGYLQNWEACCGSSPKMFDVANHASSCGQTELTVNNRGGTAQPMAYGACGGYGIYVDTNTGLFSQNTPYNFQSGYYNCEYPDTSLPPGGCFTMPADTWMTFYEHVHIGTYEQSNSVFELWVSTGTGPLQYLIKIPDFVMPTPDGGVVTGYDSIWFNVYMTGFNGNNQAANVWLDEVIVSTQPIAAPSVAPAVP